ncbi:hypothetical protein QWY93_05630 [Echinicola jeungdonensis]|uniref:Uncharacterized protein n=1 Tax=Echinicola jeungdonensis TaxID=709343 RepID=A0ABV5J4X1_9BACT|nr:hypothetical protein [Echinicola jeungdonensis]MDN3668803.1 hypothetical protein [Echinicola jeungdonensis]
MKRFYFLWAFCMSLFFTGVEIYGQSCTICDTTITVSGTESRIFDMPANAFVCITGSGVFNGELNLSDSSTVCIDEGITFEISSDFTQPNSANWGQMWSGSWVVNNYGKFVGNTVLTIQDGQVFNNYSYGDYQSYGDVDADLAIEAGFYIPPGGEGREENNQLNIENGGVFNNYGSINVSGDLVNNGEFNSTEEEFIVNVGNEFHNESGNADIYSLRAHGEITNTGEITLRGIIESVTDGFRNARGSESGTVIGIGSPCVIIRTATFIENNGESSLLDGRLGTIVLDSGEDNYDRSGKEEQDVLQANEVTDGECLRILPVVWQDIEAQFIQENKNVRIIWTTTKEWENSHFEIERSVDDAEDFKVIGKVEGLGWTSTLSHYEFVDEQLPFNATRIYYRVKQVDFDEEFVYSKVLSVKIPNAIVKSGVWRVYPNPIKGKRVSIELMKKQAYNGEVLRVRVIGPLHSTPFVSVSSVENLKTALEDALLILPKGLIVFEIQWGDKVEFIKMIYSD